MTIDAPPVTADAIGRAAAVIRENGLRTPQVESEALSELTGARVVLKLENLQPTCSFKVRGALIKLMSLDADECRRGVVAVSAGNHAQGVAYHAHRLGIPAAVVMPKGTPFSKVARTESLGARVILAGADLSECRQEADALQAAEGLVFIHPYDDPRIVTGQGTVGVEMLEEDPDLDCLVIPVGGGGLIAGVATAVKAVRPQVEIIGVECAFYPSMNQAVRGGSGTPSGGQTVAEGIAVKEPGTLTRPIVEALVDDLVVVNEAALERAIGAFLERQRLAVEGAGAAPLAAMTDAPDRFRDRRVGVVVSGGNIDSRLLASILMRGLVRDGRLARLRVEIHDSPGILARVSGLIGESGGNIVEVHHRRLFYDVPVKLAEVDVVVETQDATHVRRLMDRLTEAGFPTRLLSGKAAEDGG